MQNPPDNVTLPFVARHRANVSGVLHGFDRLRLRGTLPSLYNPSVLARYLWLCHVLFKGFKEHARALSQRILDAALLWAETAGRPSVYLASTRASKEQTARQIAREHGVNEGPIALLRCVEPCQTYHLRGSQPVLLPGKCLHLYFYQIHPRFGFMHLRLQTWFPFQVEICLNGREWLSQQLDGSGIGYQRQENYFAQVDDLPRAQAFLDEQSAAPWEKELAGLLDQCHPLHKEICAPLSWEYYWTCCESEYATDVMFKDPRSLKALYPGLVRHALLNFGSPDVLRFLGRNVPLSGRSKFAGEIVTDLPLRPEGLRVKHRAGRNSLKMYDKFGRGLRVETTINHCEDFQVYRPPQDKPQEPPHWRSMRRSIADLGRRAQISRAANQRYLLALDAVEEKTPLKELARPLCQPRVREGRRHRAINPWSPRDGALLEAINQAQWNIAGMRNRDLRAILYGKGTSEEERRASARMSRQLALLRAHGILRKVPRTHRYHLTDQGRIIVASLLAARHASAEELLKKAA